MKKTNKRTTTIKQTNDRSGAPWLFIAIFLQSSFPVVFCIGRGSLMTRMTNNHFSLLFLFNWLLGIGPLLPCHNRAIHVAHFDICFFTPAPAAVIVAIKISKLRMEFGFDCVILEMSRFLGYGRIPVLKCDVGPLNA